MTFFTILSILNITTLLKIIKAFLLTPLMMMAYIPQPGLRLLIKNTNIIEAGLKVHTLAFVIVGTLLFCLIIFRYFWKLHSRLENVLFLTELDS